MNTKTKDMLKSLTEQHIAHLSLASYNGVNFTDGQHVALAMHSMTLQMAEVAAALGRIYMAIDKLEGK